MSADLIATFNQARTHPARCTAGNSACRAPATAIVRYTDNQGRPLRQRKLCDRHTDKLGASTPSVRSAKDEWSGGRRAAMSRAALHSAKVVVT